MKKEKMTYEEAMARLEALVRQIESNETGIDKLAALVKEAQQLTAFCREKLYATALDFSALSGKLGSLSPLSVLSRGYGAVFDGEGKVITKVSETFKGKEITVKMSDGEFGATVTDIWPDAKTVVTEN